MSAAVQAIFMKFLKREGSVRRERQVLVCCMQHS